jgi:streptogramin lyase
LWFTEAIGGGRIGRITPTGTVTRFFVPGGSDSFLGEIVMGPDGNLWFTQRYFAMGFSFGGAIGRITPQGEVTYSRQSSLTPGSIAAGPDGNLWFTQSDGNSSFISRITTDGIVTDFPSPAGDIVAGPDGNLWFTANNNRIGRITTGGAVTEFPIPTPASGVFAITAGPDGNVWFTESLTNQIGRITRAGVIAEFPIPTPQSSPSDITAGPDGNLWFTEIGANQIGRITPSGAVTEFPIPTSASGLAGITVGPDGNIWFTESFGNKIGRITTGLVTDEKLILPVVGSTPGVGGSFFRTSVQLHNSGTTYSNGGIRFHASGTTGGPQDPVLPFTLVPGETLTIPDLLPAMERSGLGSVDVSLTLGSAANLPVVTARVFNDAGPAGTTGFVLNGVPAEEALRTGERAVLLVPSDLTDFRLNLGVRTLNADVTLTVTVRYSYGGIAAVVSKFFPPVYHQQQPADTFLDGFSPPPGGSITVSVEAGAAIFYGATVDNRTGDPSLQIARATR